MYFLLVTRTLMGLVVGRMSAIVMRRWWVAAMSNPSVLGDFVGGEGPSKLLFKFKVDWLL